MLEKKNWTWTKSILIYRWNLKHGGTLLKNSLLNRHLMNWQGLLNRHMMSWLKMVMWHLSELNKWASQVRLLRSNLHLEFWGSRNMEFSFSSPKPHVAKWHESGAEKGRVPITKREGRNSGRGKLNPLGPLWRPMSHSYLLQTYHLLESRVKFLF